LSLRIARIVRSTSMTGASGPAGTGLPGGADGTISTGPAIPVTRPSPPGPVPSPACDPRPAPTVMTSPAPACYECRILILSTVDRQHKSSHTGTLPPGLPPGHER
jgi:hypothetical protein